LEGFILEWGYSAILKGWGVIDIAIIGEKCPIIEK